MVSIHKRERSEPCGTHHMAQRAYWSFFVERMSICSTSGGACHDGVIHQLELIGLPGDGTLTGGKVLKGTAVPDESESGFGLRQSLGRMKTTVDTPRHTE